MTNIPVLENAQENLDRMLPDYGGCVLCAVSGGLDSMCLLHLLMKSAEGRSVQVVAAHFHHGLRGEAADRDEAFVRERCAQWSLPFVSGRGDVGALAKREGLSVEEAGRRLRYEFLRQEKRRAGASQIYTAHHADDNAETMLLNLIRGTGLRGLTGISQECKDLRRPLLGTTRAELEAYAAAWGIPHVEDETNADDSAATRNLLRHQVMPVLKSINPRAVEAMGRTAGILGQLDRELEASTFRRADQAVVQKGLAVLDRGELAEAPPSVAPRMLLELLDRMGAGRKDVGMIHLEGLLELAVSGAEGAQLDLPHGVRARIRGRQLLLELKGTPPEDPVPLTEGVWTRWGSWKILCEKKVGEISKKQHTFLMNYDKIIGLVSVGPWRPSGRMTVGRGARSLKRLFADRGIPPAERDTLPVLYWGDRPVAALRIGVDRDFAAVDGDPALAVTIQQITDKNKGE